MWASRMKVDPALAVELDRARIARDWQGAFNTLKKISRNSTDPVPELIVKGNVIQARTSDKKDWEAPRVMFEKALEKYPNDTEALAFLGLIHAASGNNADALKALRPLAWTDVSSLTPWEARVALLACEQRGTVLQRAPDPDGALQSYQLFLEIAQKVSRTLPLDETLRGAAERVMLSTAAIHFARQNKAKTLETYRQAVRHPMLASDNRSRVMRAFLHFLTYHISRVEWTPFTGVSDDLYSPSNPVEEALLLARLLEDFNRKGYGWKDADATLPLINHSVILFSLWAQAHLAVVEELEKALAFPLQPSSPLWFQYGLSLISTGKHWRGLVALEEHLSEHKRDAVAHLMAAKVCINYTSNIDAALQHALTAAQHAEPSLLPRAREAEGICYLVQASRPLQADTERKRLLGRALETLNNAYSLDSGDYAIAFHLALAYAHARETAKALHFVGAALEARREHAHSWALFALLLSAKKDYERALAVCRTGLQLFPDDIQLMLLKTRIEASSGNNEAALRTLLATFKSLRTRKETNEGGSESGFSVSRSARNEDGPTPSVGKGSAKASTLSDGNVSTERPEEKPITAAKLLADLWLQSAGLFLAINQLEEAMQCLSEARIVIPADESPAEGLCIEGMLTERTGNTRAARELYHRALVFNPNHVRSLCHLGELQLRDQELVLAETTLSNAILVDPLCHEAWRLLGAVYKQRERFDQASDCLLTSLELEEGAPVLSPSQVVPVVLY